MISEIHVPKRIVKIKQAPEEAAKKNFPIQSVISLKIRNMDSFNAGVWEWTHSFLGNIPPTWEHEPYLREYNSVFRSIFTLFLML